MKKILAVFLLSLLVFSLAACVPGGGAVLEYDPPSCRQDENGVYYTPLDIELKAYPYYVENGEMRFQFELIVGLRSTVGKDFLLDLAAEEKLGKLINDKTGIGFKYNGEENVGENFIRYSYVIEDQQNILIENDRKFGFFFIERSFTIDNPEWAVAIRNRVHSAVTELFNELNKGNVKIDNDAISLRYYFAASSGFYADNAVEVYDPETAIGYFMWNESDIAELPINYKVMASGWYILPIIIGVIVVVILIFTLKGKKNTVFLTEQPSDESDFSQQPNDKEDGASEGSANSEITVLEGQVTMEEVLNSEESESENG